MLANSTHRPIERGETAGKQQPNPPTQAVQNASTGGNKRTTGTYVQCTPRALKCRVAVTSAANGNVGRSNG